MLSYKSFNYYQNSIQSTKSKDSGTIQSLLQKNLDQLKGNTPNNWLILKGTIDER
jgi:NADPH-dependent 7-cyano-7-deazaguanine reductase QueF-like protein